MERERVHWRDVLIVRGGACVRAGECGSAMDRRTHGSVRTHHAEHATGQCHGSLRSQYGNGVLCRAIARDQYERRVSRVNLSVWRCVNLYSREVYLITGVS